MNPIREAMAGIPGHWSKGRLKDPYGNFCGIGHLSNVLGRERHYEFLGAASILDKVSFELFPERGNGRASYVRFNDHEDTTEADVMQVFEKAATKWDEEV